MDYLLTLKEIQNLSKRESDLLKEEKEINERLKEISDTSNFSATSEYQSLHRRLSKEIPQKLADIRHKKDIAKVIDESSIVFDGETVVIGTKVILDYGDEMEEFSIRAVYENDNKNKIVSCNSPIAQTVLGHKKGEDVLFMNGVVKIVDVVKV